MQKHLETFVDIYFTIEDIPSFARSYVLSVALDIIAEKAKLPIERLDTSGIPAEALELLRKAAIKFLRSIARWQKTKDYNIFQFIEGLLAICSIYNEADNERNPDAYLM